MIGIYDTPDAYICERCGRMLEGNETQLSYDDTLVCRMCGGDAVPAYRCEICDNLTIQDNVYGYEHKVCHECVEKMRYNVDLGKKVGDRSDATECVLNSYLCHFFTNDEINDLMLAALKERSKIKPVDGLSYLHWRFNDAADVLYQEKWRNEP